MIDSRHEKRTFRSISEVSGIRIELDGDDLPRIVSCTAVYAVERGEVYLMRLDIDEAWTNGVSVDFGQEAIDELSQRLKSPYCWATVEDAVEQDVVKLREESKHRYSDFL